MSVKCRKILPIILISFVFIIQGVFGATTGKIAGTVKDVATREPLAGVNVFIEGYPYGAATDGDGYYFILNIPPGKYIVTAQMVGYASVNYTNVKISSDLTTQIHFELKTEMLQGEVIVVTAERGVQKDITSSEISVTTEEIEALPMRGIGEIISLQAGVVKDSDNKIHIRGGRSSEIAYMIDGVQVLDPTNRSWGVNIDDQSISELKTITGTFNAEYGQALSGVVNIVTKKGSDDFKYNITGYMGDYFSTNDVYSVMSNSDWANASARALTGVDENLDYEVSGNSSDKNYLTQEKYLNSYNPFENYDIQANFSGPVIGTNKKITYYASARYNDGKGYDFGKRYFMPWGFQDPVSDIEHTFKQPANELVSLNRNDNFSSQTKLFFVISQSMNLSYGLYYQKNHRFSVDEVRYKYVPDAGKNYKSDIKTHILTFTHILSPSTFYEFKGSIYNKKHENYLYEDPYDYRYMPMKSSDFEEYVFGGGADDNITVRTNANDFWYYGNPLDRSKQTVKYNSIRFDFTSQVNKHNLVKTGVSGRFHDLTNDWYELQISDVDYRPIIPSEESPFHVKYDAKPKEFAAYIQDKIEFDELIINIGLRFDYFDPDGRILADPMDPQIYDPFRLDNIYKNYTETTPDSELVEYTIAERDEFWYKNVDPKYQLSPRLGLSFPITEKGVIHFAYGHFFQNPEFRFLYDNPNFWIEGAGASQLVGNANLNAERTITYEVGLQQEFYDGYFLHITGFYRDIRDWVGTSKPIDTYRGITYYKYENKDYASAKGVTLSGRANINNFNVNCDYTYMIVEGTSSDPKDAYNDAQNNRAPRLTMINLNWDQRHSFNAILNYWNKGWNATLIGNVASGFPYTPSFARGEVSGSGTFVGLRENSEFQPLTTNLDFRLSKKFKVGKLNLTMFFTALNFLDIRNVRYVYSDTGQADYTLDGINQQDRPGDPDVEISEVDEYFTRPGYYSAPRFLQIGFRISN